MSFYMTLLSDASLDTFPENTQTEFQNLVRGLPESLDENWSVGLVQFTAPFSWNNITSLNNTFGYFEGQIPGIVDIDGAPALGSYLKVSIDEGYYSSVDAILQEMMEKMTPLAQENIKFKYKAHLRRVAITVINQAAIIWPTVDNVTSYLGEMLGFPSDSPMVNSVQIGKYEVDYKRTIRSLFVYSDITKPCIVGGRLAPLLRTIPVTVERDQLIATHFDSPDYHPLRITDFNSIGISIKDDSGKPIKFESGKVLVKLHFKHNAHGNHSPF